MTVPPARIEVEPVPTTVIGPGVSVPAPVIEPESPVTTVEPGG